MAIKYPERRPTTFLPLGERPPKFSMVNFVQRQLGLANKQKSPGLSLAGYSPKFEGEPVITPGVTPENIDEEKANRLKMQRMILGGLEAPWKEPTTKEAIVSAIGRTLGSMRITSGRGGMGLSYVGRQEPLTEQQYRLGMMKAIPSAAFGGRLGEGEYFPYVAGHEKGVAEPTPEILLEKAPIRARAEIDSGLAEEGLPKLTNREWEEYAQEASDIAETKYRKELKEKLTPIIKFRKGKRKE